MLSETVMVEARPFVCPRESCQHQWLCFRWKEYVQCPVCHATITINPKRQPRASYNKRTVQKGKADQTNPQNQKTQTTQTKNNQSLERIKEVIWP